VVPTVALFLVWAPLARWADASLVQWYPPEATRTK
jgi:hypothetical protein